MNLLSRASRDVVSVVRIRESPYYGGFFFKKINFVGPLKTVRIREASVPTRGSTVYKIAVLLNCQIT